MGVVIVLAADRIGLEQLCGALIFQAGGVEVGLGFGQSRLGAVVGGLVGVGLDEVEHVALLHVRAFLKATFTDKTADFGPDLGLTVRHGAPGHFAGQGDGGGGHVRYGHPGSGHLHGRPLRGGVLPVAGAQSQGQASRDERRNYMSSHDDSL